MQFVKSQKDSAYLLDDVRWYFPIDVLVKYLRQGECIVGTDGSATADSASFSWIVSTQDGHSLVSNTGVCNGEDKYSYRSEILAILSFLFFLDLITQFHHNWTVTLSLHTISKSFFDRPDRLQYYENLNASSMSQFQTSEWELVMLSFLI